MIGFLCFPSYWAFTHVNVNFNPSQVIDAFNGVKIYYNGGMNTVTGRNLAPDGYNLGL